MELTPTRSALADLRTMIETAAVFAGDCAQLPDLSAAERRQLAQVEAQLMATRDRVLPVMAAHRGDVPGRTNGHARTIAASGRSLLAGLRSRAERTRAAAHG